jgi:hypothetical protein
MGEGTMGHPADEVLDLYLDGGLTTAERAAVEAHLAGCARCGRALAEARALYAVFATVPAEPLPVDLAPRVLRRVSPAAGARRRWLVAGLLAAQALLATLLALWLAPLLVAEYLPAATWPGIAWPATDDLLPPGIGALGFLAPLQWALVVIGTAAVWLVGNWLIVARTGRRAAGEVG